MSLLSHLVPPLGHQVLEYERTMRTWTCHHSFLCVDIPCVSYKLTYRYLILHCYLNLTTAPESGVVHVIIIVLCVITHAYADSVSLIPLRTLVSSADLFALMSRFLVTSRTVRCHVLSPSSSRGSQSSERQPLNPTFGNQHRHVISWANEGEKSFLRLRRCYRTVFLSWGKLHRWSLKCNNPVFLKSTGRRRDVTSNPPMPRQLESVISMHVCSCVCVCVLVLCWVAGGWEDQRRLCLFIKGHCSGEQVAVISSVALLLMLLSCSSTELVITYKSDKHSVSL